MMMKVTVLCQETEVIWDGERHELVQLEVVLLVGLRAQRKEKCDRKMLEMRPYSMAAAGRSFAAEGYENEGASGRARTGIFSDVGLP